MMKNELCTATANISTPFVNDIKENNTVFLQTTLIIKKH